MDVVTSVDLRAETEKNQLIIIPQLASAGSWDVLKEFLYSVKDTPANLVMAKAYQLLYQSYIDSNTEFLASVFPTGITNLNSERNVDYLVLERLLVGGEYEAADTLTREKLTELAGEEAVKRKWVYFSEVQKLPITDLQTIDRLWWLHSEGKFGYSVQRQIWLSLGEDFNKLWPKIGWKKERNWTKYPSEFIWNLTAPRGHLPLSNQLRGVRVIASIFAHPAWSVK